MTSLQPGTAVTRLTRAVYRGRQLVVTVTNHTIMIREQGRRQVSAYEVPIEAVHSLGAKIKVREARAEKKSKKSKNGELK